MKNFYAILSVAFVLILSSNLLCCGGPNGEKTEPPPETSETTVPARAVPGDHPGEFTLDDVEITVLAREPFTDSQAVVFVYLGPYFSKATAVSILEELKPQLKCGTAEPSLYSSWESVVDVGYHETSGKVFLARFTEGTGDCSLTINTAEGPVTIELGDAATTYRYAEKVRPGVKVNLRSGPTTEASVVRVLEPGDIVFPTGQFALAEIATEDDVELLLFKKVLTPLPEDGWVIADDEIFEYAGYIERPTNK